MLSIYLLGATGSIGTQVLDVIRKNNDFKLKSISVGKNIELADEIIAEFSPEYVSVIDEQDATLLKNKHPNISVGYGEASLIEASTYSNEKGVLVNAVVGMVGLIPTIEAIKIGRDILLANKETLVVAGDIINSLVKEYNVALIPIDSEHSAIHQCLKSGNSEDVSRIIITASGGALRNYSLSDLENVSVEDALTHPNWKMGAKITIDSATMVNKGLEVIEAHHLFNMEYDKIETVLHYESIVHSMVEFNDSSIIAHLGTPDMRVPIQYALNYPNKVLNPSFKKLDFNSTLNLSFKPMDFKRYPLLELAYKVGKLGGIMPCVYNAANEVAVSLFLTRKIKFLEIDEIISNAVRKTTNIIKPSIEEILAIDKEIRIEILEKYEVM